jgi:glycosyltransferase involved in cell wall biosynthesis
MKLSIIAPAYNEERLLPACLEAIDAAVAANAGFGFATEVVVVDNNSTDRTAELAREAGARVCFEPVNQIARARNVGAEAATGEWLMFVDADSFISAGLLEDVFRLIEAGNAVGCGSTVQMDGLPRWAWIILKTWTWMSIVCRWAAGSLLVCRADAFREVGGFSLTLFAAEEIDVSRRLKKWGRRRRLKFFILRRHPLASSPRKLELYSGGEIARQFLGLALRPRRALRDKKLLSLWYDGRR